MKSYLLYLTAFILILLSWSRIEAKEDGRRYTLGNTRYHVLSSRNTGKQHELIISLPENYGSAGDKNYPVFFYLDAYWDTGLLNGTYGNLRFDNLIPEMIMVGLSYPGSGVVYDQERLRDLSPTSVGGDTGGAAKFLAFLEEEAIPLVEKKYRISKDRALGGVSMGGLFSLYAMYKNPQLFERYIAISPAVEWDREYLAKLDREFNKTSKTLPARLFLSYGSDEYHQFRDPIIRFQKQLAGRNYKNFALQNHVMEGLRHTGVKGDGYVRGLMWVWKDQAPAGPSGLERLYRALEPAKTQ